MSALAVDFERDERGRPVFGSGRIVDRLDQYDGRMGGLPLVTLCTDPPATLRHYERTGRAPCFRCLANDEPRTEARPRCHLERSPRP